MLSQTSIRFAQFLDSVELSGDLEGARLIDLLPCPLHQITQYEIHLQRLTEAMANLLQDAPHTNLATDVESLTVAATLMQRVSMVFVLLCFLTR